LVSFRRKHRFNGQIIGGSVASPPTILIQLLLNALG
jgi:hypothetical protein